MTCTIIRSPKNQQLFYNLLKVHNGRVVSICSGVWTVTFESVDDVNKFESNYTRFTTNITEKCAGKVDLFVRKVKKLLTFMQR